MLVVIAYKGKKAVWQVIEVENNCEVIADDFKTAEAAHEWIDALNQVSPKANLKEV